MRAVIQLGEEVIEHDDGLEIGEYSEKAFKEAISVLAVFLEKDYVLRFQHMDESQQAQHYYHVATLANVLSDKCVDAKEIRRKSLRNAKIADIRSAVRQHVEEYFDKHFIF